MDDRVIGGVTCSQVLAWLSDFVDGELPGDVRQKVEAHLAGCDACERFGAELVKTLEVFRLRLRNEV